MSLIPLVYRAPVVDGSGYSVNSRNLLIQLHKSGKYDIQLESYYGSTVKADITEDLAALFNGMLRNKVNKDEAVLVQVSVGQQFLQDCKWNIGYSVFETDRVPFSWVIPSNKMDAVCVPCHQNKEAFEASGITVPVYVVPHGVETRTMNSDVRPFSMFNDRMNFLFLGTPQYRKGIDIAIYAYLDEFGDSDDTRLICKVYLEKASYDEELSRVRHLVKESRKTLKKTKGEIVIIPEFISEQQLARLYKSATALVFPSRGEGWGFAGSEAAACGVPVIGPGWGGPADYLNDDIAYVLGVEMVPVQNMQFNPQFLLAQMEGHKWGEPRVEDLRRAMRSVYTNPELARKKGEAAAIHMATNFNWDLAGQALINVIDKTVAGEK